jgi:Type III restriction enzyme, res subunit
MVLVWCDLLQIEGAPLVDSDNAWKVEMKRFMKERGNAVVLLTSDQACSNTAQLVSDSKLFECIEVADEEGVVASSLHEEIRFRFRRPVSASVNGRVVGPDVDAETLMPSEDLAKAIEDAISSRWHQDRRDGTIEDAISSRGGGETATQQQKERPLVGMFFDDDGSVLVRLCFSGIGYIHSLRDMVLGGDLDKVLTALVQEKDGCRDIESVVDCSEFADKYEKTILRLDTLTPHQQEMLGECLKDRTAGTGVHGVHLEASAGAGKTFVAMKAMRKVLSENEGTTKILFVANNSALVVYVVKWLLQQEEKPSQERELLKRVHVLYEPFNEGPRAVQIDKGTLKTSAAKPPVERYDFVVMDEYHHLARNGLHEVVDMHMRKGKWLMLLSDVSQGDGSVISDPDGLHLHHVSLTECVRSSQCIVAGARAFQMNKKGVEATVSMHGVAGPPLGTLIFGNKGVREKSQEWYQLYADRTVEAIEQHVMSKLASLNLDDRMLVVVPDQDFCDHFKDVLQERLKTNFGAGGRKPRFFKMVSALESSSTVRREWEEGMEERIVVDWPANIDGLEKLIVIGVCLDKAGAALDGALALETRSVMFRVTTRALMLFIIVNELLKASYLEFRSSLFLPLTSV